MHVSKNNNYTNTTTKSWWMYVIITSYSSGSHLQYRTEDEMGCLLNMTKMFASIGQIRRRFLYLSSSLQQHYDNVNDSVMRAHILNNLSILHSDGGE